MNVTESESLPDPTRSAIRFRSLVGTTVRKETTVDIRPVSRVLDAIDFGSHSSRPARSGWMNWVADLRTIVTAISLLGFAVASPSSADSFTAGGQPRGSAVSAWTGLGRVTDGFKQEAMVENSTVTADTWLAADRAADWYAEGGSGRGTGPETLSATEIVASDEAPSNWPIATVAAAPETPDLLADAWTDEAPRVFGDYVNTYSTYGVWETIDPASAPATVGDWLASTRPATSGLAMVGDNFLLTDIERSAGLRNAVVAVPEPSNVVASIVGLGTLFGLNMRRRSKRRTAVA